MHALLVLSILLLVLLSAQLILTLSQRVQAWNKRRKLQLLVLVAPVTILGPALVGVHHFVGQLCLVGAPGWDRFLAAALVLGVLVVAVGGLLLSFLRLTAMRWILSREYRPAPPELQAMVDDLADRLGAPRAEVFVSARDRPFAIAAGFTRPTLLVSQWMLSQLDSGELASVVAHEIAHVARRDYLVGWLATLLRDAFYYLPTSRTAHRQLQREKEIACDELAASLTKRPLALASALAKVWQQGAQGAAFAGAQGLASPGSNALIEGRIIRLLASPIPEPRLENSIRPLLLSAASILGLVLAEAASGAAFLATMGCASGWPVAAVL